MPHIPSQMTVAAIAPILLMFSSLVLWIAKVMQARASHNAISIIRARPSRNQKDEMQPRRHGDTEARLRGADILRCFEVTKKEFLTAEDADFRRRKTRKSLPAAKNWTGSS